MIYKMKLYLKSRKQIILILSLTVRKWSTKEYGKKVKNLNKKSEEKRQMLSKLKEKMK